MLGPMRVPYGAWIGLILTGLLVICALFAPWIAPYGNGEIVADVWEPMSSVHWLGTDNLGRDLLSRMIYGARLTIYIAAMATALSFSLGAILGFTAAVVGGKLDMLISERRPSDGDTDADIWSCRPLSAALEQTNPHSGNGNTEFDAGFPSCACSSCGHQRYGLR